MVGANSYARNSHFLRENPGIHVHPFAGSLMVLKVATFLPLKVTYVAFREDGGKLTLKSPGFFLLKIIAILRGSSTNSVGGFKYVFNVHPYLGKIPILTTSMLFLKGVVQPPTSKACMLSNHVNPLFTKKLLLMSKILHIQRHVCFSIEVVPAICLGSIS